MKTKSLKPGQQVRIRTGVFLPGGIRAGANDQATVVEVMAESNQAYVRMRKDIFLVNGDDLAPGTITAGIK